MLFIDFSRGKNILILFAIDYGLGELKHAILNIKLLALINTHTGLVNSRVVRSMVRSGCPL
jgi:hypothetical protein